MPTLNMKALITNADVAVTDTEANASPLAPRRFTQVEIVAFKRPSFGDAAYGTTPGSFAAMAAWSGPLVTADGTLDGNAAYWKR